MLSLVIEPGSFVLPMDKVLHPEISKFKQKLYSIKDMRNIKLVVIYEDDTRIGSLDFKVMNRECIAVSYDGRLFVINCNTEKFETKYISSSSSPKRIKSLELMFTPFDNCYPALVNDYIIELEKVYSKKKEATLNKLLDMFATTTGELINRTIMLNNAKALASESAAYSAKIMGIGNE